MAHRMFTAVVLVAAAFEQQAAGQQKPCSDPAHKLNFETGEACPAQKPVGVSSAQISTKDAAVTVEANGFTINTPSDGSLDLPKDFNDLKKLSQEQNDAVSATAKAVGESVKNVSEEVKGVERRAATATKEALGSCSKSVDAGFKKMAADTKTGQDAVVKSVISKIEGVPTLSQATIVVAGAEPVSRAGGTTSIYGRGFVPWPDGLYKCKWASGSLKYAGAGKALSTSEIQCQSPKNVKKVSGKSSWTMAVTVEEAGVVVGVSPSRPLSTTFTTMPPVIGNFQNSQEIKASSPSKCEASWKFTLDSPDDDVSKATFKVTSSDEKIAKGSEFKVTGSGKARTLVFTRGLRCTVGTTTLRVEATSQLDVKATSNTFVLKILVGANRFAPGFKIGRENHNMAGLDLSATDGYEQCYGWVNTGSHTAPPHSSMQKHCGKYNVIKFAGWRCGASKSRSNMVEHDVYFPKGKTFLSDWAKSKTVNRANAQMSNVPGKRKGGHSVKYNWHGDGTWYLLTWQKGYKMSNGVTDDGAWSDPGRLWEPSVGGASRGCAGGHVLSQTGLNSHDAHQCCGDSYFVYGRMA